MFVPTVFALLAGASAAGNSSYVATQVPSIHGQSTVFAQQPATTVYTTVVDTLTTYCPGPTTFATNGQTYTVTEPTTLTISDCPCTVVHSSAHSPSQCTRTIDNTVTRTEVGTKVHTVTLSKNSNAGEHSSASPSAPAGSAPAAELTNVAPSTTGTSQSNTSAAAGPTDIAGNHTTYITEIVETLTMTISGQTKTSIATITDNNIPTAPGKGKATDIIVAPSKNGTNPSIVVAVPSNQQSDSPILANSANKVAMGTTAAMATLIVLFSLI